MKLNKAQEAEVLEAYKVYFDGYVNGDVPPMISLLSDDYNQIGSAEAEVFFNKEDAAKFIHETIDQIAGKTDIRNRTIKVDTLDEYFLITDLFDIYVLMDDEWSFYSKFRASTLMQHRNDGWKFVHQHSSMPDARTEEGENIAIEKITNENLQLREAVKRRTVELEHKNQELKIEASLERIRTVAMSMQKAEDLLVVVETLFIELKTLGFTDIRNTIINIFNDTKEIFLNYDYSDYGVGGISEVDYNSHPSNKKFVNEMREVSTAFMISEFTGKELDEWRKWRSDQGQMPDPRLDQAEGLYYYEYSIGVGSIGISTFSPVNADQLKILDKIRNVFDLAYQRYADIAQAEAQAREAKIEVALERVRAKTMAMHQASELQDVINIVHQQFRNLKMDISGGAFIAINEEFNNGISCWGAGGTADYVQRVQIPFFDRPIYTEIVKRVNKGPGFFSEEFTHQEKIDFFKHLFKHPPYSDAPAAQKKEVMERPGGYTRSTVVSEHTNIFIINHHGRIFSDEDNDILKRFGKVFEQTYTRFMDLQKAEDQAREAQIETALERVRSKTMAMHNSSDVGDTVYTLFEEVLKLGIDKSIRCGLGILEGSERHMETRSATLFPNGEVDFKMGMLDMTIHPMLIGLKKAWQRGDKGYSYYYDTEDVIRYYKALNIEPEYPFFVDIDTLPEEEFHNSFFFKEGILFAFSPNPMSEEASKILNRFASVFGQTYRRYLDLQKAESQAREAQIELSLERIRAQATAMKESSDLLDIVVTMRTEFVSLGHEAHYFWYMRYLPEIYEKAMTSGDGTRIGMVMTLPRHIHGDIKYLADWEKSEEPTVVFAMDVETAVDYVHKMITLGDFKQVDHNAPTLDDIRHIGGLTFIMARTTYGEIGFSLPGNVPNPPQEDLDTLVRFASVFDLAYRRFEDLKSAEQQNRESQIELALERVRAKALAMQQPEEIKEVADVMRHEMGLLGVEELETSSIYINDGVSEEAECWYALKDIREEEKTLVKDYFTLDLKVTWVGREMLKFFQSDKDQTSIVMTGDPRVEWIRYCEEKSVAFRGYYGEEIPDRIYHLYKFSHGAIGAATAGEISEENWGLLKRAASVFSLAYSRFKDLNQARIDLQLLKTEKKRAEDALGDLKEAQSQLIHAEKMASLGELTAGIAHEIQNPLNFVKNFSEVNIELISELKEEFENGDMEEVKAIAADLEGNVEKVVHHGKRADAIVKGMLQHSRGSGDEKEFTDINALADEYLRLSFHGLRAKDKTFNADFSADLDESLPKLNVLPQDIGRVFLNLINNAFFTVSEKKKLQGDNYKPIVKVSTKMMDDYVEIRVIDNGHGIPSELCDKIFQPFFTTKATGEGTGLGLSLSYEIITKGHGGELKVETKEGLGTEFIIQLKL